MKKVVCNKCHRKREVEDNTILSICPECQMPMQDDSNQTKLKEDKNGERR